MPAGVLSRALGVAAGSTGLFWVSCDGPGLPYAAAWFGVMFLFILAVLLGPALVKAARARVGLDEGGVRCKMGGYSTYYPFDLVGLGSLGANTSGIPCLILEDRTDRPFLKVPLLDQGAQASARAFIAEYERRRLERPAEVPRTASLLQRNGRRIQEWIAAPYCRRYRFTNGCARYRGACACWLDTIRNCARRWWGRSWRSC
jgi:hypothetical protein